MNVALNLLCNSKVNSILSNYSLFITGLSSQLGIRTEFNFYGYRLKLASGIAEILSYKSKNFEKTATGFLHIYWKSR